MGSSGMKRKGRTHLPKVGTRPANEHELHERREEALHPFSEDPWRPRRWSPVTGIVAAAVGVLIFVGVIALIAFT
jgi:hypothetical protein